MEKLVLKPRSDKKPCGAAVNSALAKVGADYEYDELYFQKGVYTVDTPLQVNSDSKIYCEPGAVIELVDKAPSSVFKSMVPIFGQRETKISNVTIEGLSYNGRNRSQSVGAGDGFHNFIFFQNATNIDVHGIHVQDSQGDGLRIKNGSKICYHDNYVYHCGHDGLYVDGGSDIEAYNNKTWLRTNSALRLRNVTNGNLHHNAIYNMLGSISSGPGIQVENSAGKKSKDITVQNNLIANTNGPGIWAINVGNTDPAAASGLTIKENSFILCGSEPAAVKVPGVAGIVSDGWNLNIEKNKFDLCKGHAVMFGNYRGVAAGKGYTAVVKDNYISNTAKALSPGVGSGSGIANLVPDKYKVTCENNSFYNNVRDTYGI